MRIEPETLRKVIASIGMLRTEEMGCDDCYEEVDKYVDMLREGADPAKIMPLVEHHLTICGPCHDEFSALLEALEANQKPEA